MGQLKTRIFVKTGWVASHLSKDDMGPDGIVEMDNWNELLDDERTLREEGVVEGTYLVVGKGEDFYGEVLC